MKPYLMLLLAAASLAAVKSADAQNSDINGATTFKYTGPAVHAPQSKATPDTGFILVTIDFSRFAGCYGWARLTPPGSTVAVYTKEINWLGGCNNAIFSGIPLGTTWVASFVDIQGQTGVSAPVTVMHYYPPAIANVSR